jgi:hypothetical protein
MLNLDFEEVACLSKYSFDSLVSYRVPRSNQDKTVDCVMGMGPIRKGVSGGNNGSGVGSGSSTKHDL